MKKYIKHIIVLSFFILLSACSEDTIDTTGTGTLKGIVIEQGSNTPIENVKVKIVASNTAVLTDAEGKFTINNIRAGEQSVSGEKDGFLASFEAITIVPSETVNVVLEMVISTATNNSPEQPTLLLPADNATDLPVDVELSWTSSDPEDDVLTYKVELRNDQNSDVVTYEDISEETLLIENLSYGVKYFWQVSVSDGVNPEVWSETQQFTINGNPNHRFLYSREIGGNGVIFSAEIFVNDIEELQLTSEGNNSWRPRKNTNSGAVAFLRSIGGETHIFTINPDGSDLQQITNAVPVAGFDMDHIDYCWYNNGAKILYPSFDKLYSINSDGSGLQLIYQTVDGSLISECDMASDGSMIALKVNDLNGYQVSIFTIDLSGSVIATVLSGVNGAAGGLNFSVDNNKLLYTHDISGFESPEYRQLDTHIFMYDFSLMTATDISTSKPAGFLDLDPRFSPNEAEIIFTHTSNDGISESKIQSIDVTDTDEREDLFQNAKMPDWE